MARSGCQARPGLPGALQSPHIQNGPAGALPPPGAPTCPSSARQARQVSLAALAQDPEHPVSVSHMPGQPSSVKLAFEPEGGQMLSGKCCYFYRRAEEERGCFEL